MRTASAPSYVERDDGMNAEGVEVSRRMSKISCRLVAHSLSPHLQQLYTGFGLLHQRGLIHLSQETRRVELFDRSKPGHLQDARHAHLRVLVNGRVRVHYDTHDSWEIDEEFLSGADVYFKRSYDPGRLSRLGIDAEKVHPLGLNYLVLPDGPDPWALRRSLVLGTRKERLLGLVQASRWLDSLYFSPRIRRLESLPDYETPPRILFMVRAWDPTGHQAMPDEKIEERVQINEMRAACVRDLRAEFGENFYGGFIHTEYAAAHYADLLLPDQEQASKREYVERVKRHAICIATTGLHGSIGWKFAEYLALSRAVVSERLNYVVAGDLREGVHFLPFATPPECVDQVRRLFLDRDERFRLMTNAATYYLANLRPDALVLNTILRALV